LIIHHVNINDVKKKTNPDNVHVKVKLVIDLLEISLVIASFDILFLILVKEKEVLHIGYVYGKPLWTKMPIFLY